LSASAGSPKLAGVKRNSRRKKVAARKPARARNGGARAVDPAAGNAQGVAARRPGRPPAAPELRRQRLVEAARKALQHTDYGSLRITDVVRRAGMSSRSFYQYFETKEDLLVQLIDEASRALLGEIESIFALPNPEERIDRLIEAYLGACVATPLDIDRMSGGLTSRVQQMVRVLARDAALQVAAALGRSWTASAERPPPDPAAIEVMFLGMLGLASRYVHEGRVRELAAVRPALRAMLLRAWS
jgi:AcrR family transcriptional regulator